MEDLPVRRVTVEGMVVSGSYGYPVDLDTLFECTPPGCCSYDPDTFPGLSLKVSDSGDLCMLLFSTGKFVVAHVKSSETIDPFLSTCTRRIEDHLIGFENPEGMDHVIKPTYEIRNVCMRGYVGSKRIRLDVEEMVRDHPSSCTYVEQLKAAAFRTSDSKTRTTMIFKNGLFVLLGLSSEEEAPEVLRPLLDGIEKYFISRE